MSSQTPTRESLVTDSLKRGARGVVLGALVSASVTAAVSSAGVAAATCTPTSVPRPGAHCAPEETSFQLNGKPPASAQGRLGGSGASASKKNPASDHVLVAESMVGTDVFGPYGCEDLVDAAFGLTTETGIGHDAALSFYQSLAARGLDHHETPIPRGALVFSVGPYGNHVDISRGDGTFVSGGVQGLSPGYGDGHQVQILPSANLGAWTMYGWVYPPW
jgi:hypothetical protein